LAGEALDGDVAYGNTGRGEYDVGDTEGVALNVFCGEAWPSDNSDAGQANRHPDLSNRFETFTQEHVRENRRDDRLNVSDNCRESRRDELSRVEHAEETHACRPEPHHYDQDPGTADRYRTMTEESEGYQANPCEGGAQGREGDMGREVQANGYERKAGGPKHHDRQKAQGGIDGHRSSGEIFSPAGNWKVYSTVIRPIVAGPVRQIEE
jgi:hypothetical protein